MGFSLFICNHKRQGPSLGDLASGARRVPATLMPSPASTMVGGYPTTAELYLFLYNGKLIAGHGVPHFDLFSLEEAAGGGGG